MADRIYRARSHTILGWTVVLFIGFIVLGIGSMSGESALARAIAGLLLVGVGFLVWRVLIRPYIQASAEGLVVVNPFNTYLISWDQIQKIYADHLLRIETQDGKAVTAWSLQAANIAPMMGRRSHADEVAEELLALASRHRDSTTQPELQPSRDIRRRVWLFAGFVLVIAVLSLAVQLTSAS